MFFCTPTLRQKGVAREYSNSKNHHLIFKGMISLLCLLGSSQSAGVALSSHVAAGMSGGWSLPGRGSKSGWGQHHLPQLHPSTGLAITALLHLSFPSPWIEDRAGCSLLTPLCLAHTSSWKAGRAAFITRMMKLLNIRTWAPGWRCHVFPSVVGPETTRTPWFTCVVPGRLRCQEPRR